MVFGGGRPVGFFALGWVGFFLGGRGVLGVVVFDARAGWGCLWVFSLSFLVWGGWFGGGGFFLGFFFCWWCGGGGFVRAAAAGRGEGGGAGGWWSTFCDGVDGVLGGRI